MRQFSLRGAIICMSLLGVLFAVCAHRLQRLRKELRGRMGEVTQPKDRPEQLRAMVATAGLSGDQMRDMRVYCLEDRIDQEFIWQFPVKDDAISEIVNSCHLVELRPEAVPNDFWHRRPTWWNPSMHSESAFFVSPGLLAGEDGLLFLVMYDKSRAVLFVWHRNRF